MKYITVNPTWNVPPSIVYNEYLPALQQDPTVLKRMGLKLGAERDGTVHISQPPGEANALGRIRFNFPNKFLVYQHDTPDKHLFAQTKRAYSHGCMRVQDPAKYAEVLLVARACPEEGYTQEDQEHVRPLRDRHALHRPDPGAHHLPDRVRGRMPASCRSARTSTAATPACSPRSRRTAGRPKSRSRGRSRTTAGRRCGCRTAMREQLLRAASRSSTACSATRIRPGQPARRSSAAPAATTTR